MATVSQIAADIQATCKKPILCQRDIQKYTGWGKNKVKRLIESVVPIGNGNGKRYFYTDVAEAILKDGKIDLQPRKKSGRPRLLDS